MNKNLVNVVFDEIKKCAEEKKGIIDRFYNKVDLLTQIVSITLSGNLILFSFIFDDVKIDFCDFKFYIYIFSTILILISLFLLLHTLSFKSIYRSKNELAILEATSHFYKEETAIKNAISLTALTNILNNNIYEKMKSQLRKVFCFLMTAIILMVIGSMLLLSASTNNVEKRNIFESDTAKILTVLGRMELKLDKIILNEEVYMPDNEQSNNSTPEVDEQIPDPSTMLNYHTESADPLLEIRKNQLKEGNN